MPCSLGVARTQVQCMNRIVGAPVFVEWATASWSFAKLHGLCSVKEVQASTQPKTKRDQNTTTLDEAELTTRNTKDMMNKQLAAYTLKKSKNKKTGETTCLVLFFLFSRPSPLPHRSLTGRLRTKNAQPSTCEEADGGGDRGGGDRFSTHQKVYESVTLVIIAQVKIEHQTSCATPPPRMSFHVTLFPSMLQGEYVMSISMICLKV